ncbi:helix-turn-helix domain-containing protein [Hutsoniella sourekii]|uniref:helix-turn-helix domain-containing protein n=1 Tax=Hutsoniella sourekii TaxID=87650 RepID=UPI000483943C|nr:helix-turn-helix domain-containing protein [Hutsoniella sourekii]
MIRLLSSKNRRQFHLINIYRNQRGLYLTLQDLADRLDCAKGTIISDLKEIQRLFPDEIEVSQTGTGVTMTFPEVLPESFYFRRFSRQSLNFRLLIDLYHHGDQPIEEVGKRLYVSRSSLYRAAEQITDFLQEIGLDLWAITSPIGLRGEETCIRVATPFLFTHYYSDVEWPFQLISRDEAVRLYEIISANSPYLQLFASNPLVYLQIAINFERYAIGYKLASDDWTITNEHLSHLLQGQDLFVNFQAQGKEYPLLELVPQIVPGLVNLDPILNDQQLATSQEIPQETKQAINSFKNQMQQLKDHYGLTSADDQDINLIALTIYNLLTACKDPVNVIIDDPVTHQRDLVQEVAYVNPTYVADVQKVIRNFMTHLSVQVEHPECFLELLMFYYLVIWPNTTQELNHDKLIDLFLYTGNYNYDLEYKSYLTSVIHNYVRIHVADGLLDWSKVLDENRYQIIMSSYHIPAAPGRYIYHIQSMPDVSTYAWLYETIRKINDSDTSMIDPMPAANRIRLV